MSGADIIRMDYQMMADMAQAFGQGSQQLEQTIAEIRNIVGMIEGGGLIGVAGDEYVNGCNAALIPALQRLCDKFIELKGDIEGAVDDMRKADQGTARYYN